MEVEELTLDVFSAAFLLNAGGGSGNVLLVGAGASEIGEAATGGSEALSEASHL